MEDAIDIQLLEEAVTVFYRSETQQQSAAHQWLLKAQLSQQAWSFVWDLMQLNKVNQSYTYLFCSKIECVCIWFASNFKRFSPAFPCDLDGWCAVLWRIVVTHKIVETLAWSAERESRRAPAKAVCRHHDVCERAENRAQPPVFVRKCASSSLRNSNRVNSIMLDISTYLYAFFCGSMFCCCAFLCGL